jgi:excisionase family DNA binding protein
MFSITSAAQHLGLPRDTILNAVRAGQLAAARDRRGVLRIAPSALAGFAAGLPGSAGNNIVPLNAMRPDRLPQVLSQRLPSPATFRPGGAGAAHGRIVFLQPRESFLTARRLAAPRRRLELAPRATVTPEPLLSAKQDGIGPAA